MLRSTATAMFTLLILLANAKSTFAVPVDLTQYHRDCGIDVRHDNNALAIKWKTREGMTKVVMNTAGRGALIESIAVTAGAGEPTVVLRNVNPITIITVGQRDLKKRGGWTIFFDRTSHKPSESGQLSFELKSAKVQSNGQRCIVELEGLKGQAFSGALRFIFYAGCDLIHVQAVVQTQHDARALLYHAGLTCDPQGKSVSWIGLDDKVHREKATAQAATPQKVRHRTIAIETPTGGVAVFPPPHRYFYPLDEAYNLGFTWRGTGFMKQVEGFGIGIRQDLLGDRRWVPWFNAPPKTLQKLGIFWLPSQDRGQKLFDRVKAYTNNDRFPQVQGHKTFTSHYHIEHATKLIDHRRKEKGKPLPPALNQPEFVDVFKKAGIQIVHLAEFHNRMGRARRDPEKAFYLLKTLHDECQRLSDNNFLLLPGEEPNVHLGGHWISFFPKSVMWSLGRPKDKPFTEVHPKYGRVYHVGSADDVHALMQKEQGLMWTAHPRIKSSTGYPDRYKEQAFFKSDRYLGAAWKAMPADLSRPRLGWRVLDLLDDTANWNAKKYIVGEVDIFKVDHTTEFYAHANINYMRLDHVPRYKDGWSPVVKALRDGAFFISTGEVLLPQFTVGGKASGQTLQLDADGKAQFKASLKWTFPMAFAEIITGDGKQVRRQRVTLDKTGAFSQQTLEITLNLKGQKWVRLEAWDIAANGVISQPIWLESK